MEISKLEEKLDKLRAQLHKLETEETEKIRVKRIAADISGSPFPRFISEGSPISLADKVGS